MLPHSDHAWTPLRAEHPGGFWLCTDKSLIDLDAVHAFLTACYWFEGVRRDVIERAIAGSLCVGVYRGEGPQREQAAFARWVTDGATFAYLCDVFVLEAFRGRGLASWMVEVSMGHPALAGVKKRLLATRDAHGIYERLGFTPLAKPSYWMEMYDTKSWRA